MQRRARVGRGVIEKVSVRACDAREDSNSLAAPSLLQNDASARRYAREFKFKFRARARAYGALVVFGRPRLFLMRWEIDGARKSRGRLYTRRNLVFRRRRVRELSSGLLLAGARGLIGLPFFYSDFLRNSPVL